MLRVIVHTCLRFVSVRLAVLTLPRVELGCCDPRGTSLSGLAPRWSTCLVWWLQSNHPPLTGSTYMCPVEGVTPGVGGYPESLDHSLALAL